MPQYSVMNTPVGVVYPSSGFTLMTASAPLPATTLLGATALVTVIVNCGVTAKTVKDRGCDDWLPDPSVPVIVMVYPI